jgi:hypothetical protein
MTALVYVCLAIRRESKDLLMEEITMTVEMKSDHDGMCAKIDRIRIGQDEVPTEGGSISQLLNNMQQQGWYLARASAHPYVGGTHVSYNFQRLVATAAV